MRFFSNDSRDDADDEAPTDERPDRVKSDPVAVPAQRPSTSPWAASPGTIPAREAGRPADAGNLDTRDDGPPAPESGDRQTFHEPSPPPTAFGASTVGGAVAASAMANPLTDAQDDTDRRTDAASGVADDRTGGPRDGVVGDATDASRDPAWPPAPDAARRGGPRHDDPVDAALQDGGTFSDPVVLEPGGQARSFAGTGSGPSGYAATPVAVPLTGGDDEPASRTDTPIADAVEAPADRRTDADPAPQGPGQHDPGQRAAGAAPAGPAPVAKPAGQSGGLAPGGQLPGSEPAPEIGPLFADAEAHSFRDRWRDVQLRFVDDPKAAAEEAAALVDDAVDALATSLRSQREKLTGAAAHDSAADTEQLRVRIRTYRDFLDRLLNL